MKLYVPETEEILDFFVGGGRVNARDVDGGCFRHVDEYEYGDGRMDRG